MAVPWFYLGFHQVETVDLEFFSPSKYLQISHVPIGLVAKVSAWYGLWPSPQLFRCSLTGDGFWDGHPTIDVIGSSNAYVYVYIYITYRPKKDLGT